MMSCDSASAPVLKILIVDDRPENITSLRQVLTRPDMEIISAHSGNEALSLMLDHDFALALLDVQMPGMDGYEVARLMRSFEKTRQVPIIFVTAISQEERHRFSGYEAGAIDYLFKPIESYLIRAKVAAFLELKRAQLAREKLLLDLNRANARLQEISDLKSDYLSAASHELRTPLTVIKEFCSLVHEEVVGPVNEEQRHCLGAALRNCNRLANLVNDLLDLDSIESGHACLTRERVDLAAVLHTCGQDIRGRFEESGQSLEVDVPASLPPVLAAPNMIIQVVVNLLGNAHKHTPEGSETSVLAHTDGSRVVVEVRDDGPGIGPDDQCRVFEKFAQLNRRDGPGARGTGLGLPISRKLIEMHGGALVCASEEDRGSCFHFDLPVYTDEAHLQAFIADGIRNLTGQSVPWHLVLLRPALGTPAHVIEGLETELITAVRSGEDRTGVVRMGGEDLRVALLKTDGVGVRSFLDRLRPTVEPGVWEGAVVDVSSDDIASRWPAKEAIVFEELRPVKNQKGKGIQHV